MTAWDPIDWRRASRRTRFLPILIVLGAIGLVAYAGLRDQLGGPFATPAALPSSPVVGVVINVDSPSLGQVLSITLQLPDGQTLDLAVGTLENSTEFSPAHLTEHKATSEPVRAFYRLEDGIPVVYRVEDASGT